MPPISAPAVATPSASLQTYPLTAAQLDIWLDQLSRGDSPLYNIGGYMDLSGPLDPALMHAALEALVSRHDAMRTILLPGAGVDGLPLQQFARSLPVPMPMPINDVSTHILTRRRQRGPWCRRASISPSCWTAAACSVFC